MQSNNPVFRRSEEFNQANHYGNQTYAGSGSVTAGFGDAPVGTQDMRVGGAPMTVDSVVQKTAISLAVVILTAAATWILTPPLVNEDGTANVDLGLLYTALMVGSLGAFALSMVNAFKRVVSPPLVLAFCAFEGVALGAFSKVIDGVFAGPNAGNLVVQAVIGTFAAFAGTLAAYKVFDIKVGSKFRMFVMAAVFGMIGLSLMELVLGMFGDSFGLFGFGGLGMLTAIAGLVLGVFMLILDFDFVEQGIRNRIPEQESWRAAFAMTVSLVWIYTNLLRLLAIFSQD
jgi:uncharacterized YccA/Bax inhibitor family protein